MVRKKVLEAVVFTLILLAFLCGCTNDVNRHVFKAVVARVYDSTGIHDFMSLQLGVDYVINRNKTASAPAARNSRDVPENEIARENTVFLLRNIDTDFDAGPVTVDDYNGEICIDYNGFEYDYSQNSGYFLRILDGSKVKIRNGKTVIFEDNPSLQAALIVNTDNVILENHIIDDRRKKGEVENTVILPNAVKVTGTGGLTITGSLTTLGNVFTVDEGGRLEIKDGTISIYEFNGPSDYDRVDFKISGGTIIHPHKVDKRIKAAAVSGASFVNKYIHVPTDFEYHLENEERRNVVVSKCMKTEFFTDCNYNRRATLRLIPGYNLVYDGTHKEACEVVYEDGWSGVRPPVQYITDPNERNNNVNSTEAKAWAVFSNPLVIGNTATAEMTFSITGNSSTGNGDWDAKLPIEEERANRIRPRGFLGLAETTGKYKWVMSADNTYTLVKDDVEGTLDCEAGDILFIHVNGYESTIIRWEWDVDYRQEVITGEGDAVEKINVFRTTPTSEERDRYIVCYPYGYGGRGDCNITLPVVNGYIWPSSQTKIASFRQSNDVHIIKKLWTLKDSETGEVVNGIEDFESDTLNLFEHCENGKKYDIILKCYFWNDNSYREFESTDYRYSST